MSLRLPPFLGTPRASAARAVAPAPPGMRALTLLATGFVLAAIYAAGCALYPGFGRPQVALNLLDDNAFLGVAAIGATFVVIAGGIDLSAGAMLACSGVAVATLVERAGWYPLAAIAAVLAAGLAFGLLQGLVVEGLGLPSFLVTLAGQFLARGLAFAIAPEPVVIRHGFYTATMPELRVPLGTTVGPRGGILPLEISFAALVLLIATAAGAFVLRATRAGRYVRASGSDAASARLLGVPVARTRIACFGIAGLCYAAGGVLYTFYTHAGDPASAMGLELDVIAAVVIGGTLLRGGVGSVEGTLLGVLVIGLIQVLLAFDGRLSSWWSRIAIGLLLLLFIALQQALVALAKRRRSGDAMPARR